MLQTIEYKGEVYPKFQAEGFASKFAFPFAQEVCKGRGYDIGCCKIDWAFPGAIPIDTSFNDQFDAFCLPYKEVDYIFSSHCLEHLFDWVGALNYWHETLKKGGVLFLYLPDFSQKYWRPWNNRKHVHCFTPEIIRAYLEEKFTKCFVSGVDLNNSFMAIAEK